jgi:hypothetical protein
MKVASPPSASRACCAAHALHHRGGWHQPFGRPFSGGGAYLATAAPHLPPRAGAVNDARAPWSAAIVPLHGAVEASGSKWKQEEAVHGPRDSARSRTSRTAAARWRWQAPPPPPPPPSPSSQSARYSPGSWRPGGPRRRAGKQKSHRVGRPTSGLKFRVLSVGILSVKTLGQAAQFGPTP